MTWTNVAKPSSSSYTKVSKPTAVRTYATGQATGIIGPPTYSDRKIIENWIDLSKPSTNSWTKISKPT